MPLSMGCFMAYTVFYHLQLGNSSSERQKWQSSDEINIVQRNEYLMSKTAPAWELYLLNCRTPPLGLLLFAPCEALTTGPYLPTNLSSAVSIGPVKSCQVRLNCRHKPSKCPFIFDAVAFILSLPQELEQEPILRKEQK